MIKQPKQKAKQPRTKPLTVEDLSKVSGGGGSPGPFIPKLPDPGGR